MWDWVRCGSLLIYVFVDNQTEKLFEKELNRDIDIYIEEYKLKKYLLFVSASVRWLLCGWGMLQESLY